MLIEVKLRPDEDEAALKAHIQKRARGYKWFEIQKKSLDARNKNEIRWVYTIRVEKEPPEKEVAEYRQTTKKPEKVVVVGSGPAGLFCAIRLIRCGIKPVIIEQGGSVEERMDANADFFQKGILDENCNVQFGEGGAGTFSDGKLNTQTKDRRNREVLRTFVEFGAPQEILYVSKPHIGSDRLRDVLRAMRAFIVMQGGEIRFHTFLKDIVYQDGSLKCVVLEELKSGTVYECNASEVVLAIGHSSRKTFEMLHRRGFAMEQRAFAVGVRIEHLQKNINFAQYSVAHTLLPPADYKLVSHAGERTAFTFCMCPGGVVIPASSEKGGVVTNGMSNFLRDEENANSALLVQINKSDFASNDVLSGVEYQRRLERLAYEYGGKTYKAPAQRVGDFLSGRISNRFGAVRPSYCRGVVEADLRRILPSYVAETLKVAILDMDRKLKGFADHDAVMTGVETRFSSPIRVLRDERGESLVCRGVYPCGEGCGYSGGITSSAADGIYIAEQISEKYM